MKKNITFIFIFLFVLAGNYSAAQSSGKFLKLYKSIPKDKPSIPRFYIGEDCITPYTGSFGNIGVSSRYILYEDEILSIVIGQVKDTNAYVLKNTEYPDKSIYPVDIMKIDTIGNTYHMTFRISSTDLHQDKLNNFKLIYKKQPTPEIDKTKKKYTVMNKNFEESDSSVVYIVEEVLNEESMKDITISNFNIEIRKKYHFRPGFGIFKSNLKSNEFEFITDINDPDHGQKVVNNGNNTTYGATLGALIYPFGHDDKLFWDKDYIGKNFENMIVFYIGIGLASKDGLYTDFFFGTGISVFKINLIAGVHYGREKHLQNGLRMDTVYPSNTFGDISKYVDSSEKFSFFYSLIVDAEVFTKFFK